MRFRETSTFLLIAMSLNTALSMEGIQHFYYMTTPHVADDYLAADILTSHWITLQTCNAT